MPVELTDWQRLGAVVVALGTVSLLACLVAATRRLWQGSPRALAAPALVAALTHALVPAQMVMVYGGYRLVRGLVEFEQLYYGPGATWIYGPLLAIAPDHAVVQGANRLMGLATLGLLWALVANLASASSTNRSRAVPLVAWLTATAPLLWRDHASESILVGAALFLVAGLFALTEGLRSRRGLWFVPAVAALAAAALTRPEMALVALPLGALVALPWLRTRRPPALLAAALVLAALIALHATWLVPQTTALRAGGAVPGMDRLGLDTLRNLVDPWTYRILIPWGPAALVLFVAAAIADRALRRPTLAALAIAAAWLVLTRVDLPPISVPRVHAPVWLLFAALGAFGLDTLLSRPRAPRIATLSAAALWLLSAAATLPLLFSPTNEATEEALIRESVAALQQADAASGLCLATLDTNDPPPRGKTPRYFPRYLLPDVVHSSLSDLAPQLHHCPGQAYALLGLRCYAHLRHWEGNDPDPPLPGSAPVQGCADFRAAWTLRPVFERDVPNHGDAGMPLYPADGPLKVGLYKVLGPAAAEP